MQKFNDVAADILKKKHFYSQNFITVVKLVMFAALFCKWKFRHNNNDDDENDIP